MDNHQYPKPLTNKDKKSKYLRIFGAREHNLKNISLSLPRDSFIVITGVSGSGKSTLAFDTIYAEGQRRYVESLSSYARQFLGRIEKPKVDLIEGLSPAISIEQKSTHRNPRSTVGTITEVYDYIRLLFARVGEPHCPNCKKKVTSVTVDQIVSQIVQLPPQIQIQILAPIAKDKKGEFRDILEKLQREGFRRIRLDGQIYLLEEKFKIEKKKKHNIDLIIDRITLKEKKDRNAQISRIAQSVETALSYGNGNMTIFIDSRKDEKEIFFSKNLYCKQCDFYLPEMNPQSFSFNSPQGACPECDGLGALHEYSEEKLIPNPNLSIMEGAIAIWSGKRLEYFAEQIHYLAKKLEFSPFEAWKNIGRQKRKAILYGHENLNYEGVIENLHRRQKELSKSGELPGWFSKYLGKVPCSVCQGGRLKPESLAVFLNHRENRSKKNIVQICAMTIEESYHWFAGLKLGKNEAKIAEQVMREIISRLKFLNNVGVDYLSLDRESGSLSGGEAQRIRLATQIGSSLMGVLYVLDEPSIGLHQKDNARLLNALMKMRDLGNTLIVVEHDEDTIRKADHIVDIGPGAGKYGGQIIANGTIHDILQEKRSLTSQYLSGQKFIPIAEKLRTGLQKDLIIRNARKNNLKNIKVHLPLGKLICVTGVSGSGKSTLINECLLQGLKNKSPLIKNQNLIESIISIDQEAIGRTPRSNPATYTGLFAPIRELFAKLPEAIIRGYQPGRFSFNVKGGRCEKCEGAGQLKIEMHFLPDVHVKCDSCNGYRFKKETLEVKFKGKNIYDILDMTVDEAVVFFEKIPRVYQKLVTLQKVGLSYMHLGQPATTLSGGEAQRIKLATELTKRGKGHILYFLDEPTTGLHFDDIRRLLHVLHELVNRGNTMIIIEHNLDVIKTADHIIDLGPEGGKNGGEVIATGTPQEICNNSRSYTGQYLKSVLKKTKLLAKKKEPALRQAPISVATL